MEIIEEIDVQLAIAWLHDLRQAGVAMPALLPASDELFFEALNPADSALLADQAHIVEGDGSCEEGVAEAHSLWGEGEGE